MWVHSVHESFWSCNWVHYCSIYKHDVSSNNNFFSVSKHCLIFLFPFWPNGLFGFVTNRAIKRSNCFHSSHGKDPCKISSNPYMIMFGAVEIIFSQIPDFDQISWLSIVAAVMSFTYSSIGLALGIAKVAGKDTLNFLTFTPCLVRGKIFFS